MDEHYVAVTVFMKAHGIDSMDATDRAVIGVRRALGREMPTPGPRGDELPTMKIVHTGDALTTHLNGYLSSRMTDQVYRTFDKDYPWPEDGD